MGCPFKPPIGHTVIYQTRRHWYEVLPETADAIFWTAIIAAFSFGLASIFVETRLIGFLVLVLYPFAHLFRELILWNSEWYVVVRTSEGKGKLVKIDALIIPLLGIIRMKKQDDGIDYVSITEETTWLSRKFGFVRVQVRSPNHVYLEGRCVPKELITAIYSVQVKRPEIPEDADTRQLVISQVANWVEQGIADIEVVKMQANKWIMET